MPSARVSVHAVLFALLLSGSALAAPPETPLVTEPENEGQLVNPADVHMESSPFSDPDGDAHLCTDWQIWLGNFNELVWEISCTGGVERVHAHLGDGTFTGSHTGRIDLLNETLYTLRVRYTDDSGAPDDTSGWGVRQFTTTALTDLTPLDISDVADSPAPTWNDTAGHPVALPTSGHALTLETAPGATLLSITPLDGTANTTTNPPPLAAHDPVSVRLQAGIADLVLPDSDLTFSADDGRSVTVYLPALTLLPGTQARFWIAETGATYLAGTTETEPSFATLARSAPTPWVARQPGYVVETVASGFRLPVNIAFVPTPGTDDHDPLFYVTELYGDIKVVLNDGHVETYASGLLNFSPTGAFPGSGEQGLTGIAVDPATGDVYAAYLHDPGGPHHPRVARFTSSDGGVTADTQTVILDMPGETQGQSHQISNLSFGPDGKLYIHMGDGFDASTAQNLDSFRGKVLRLNTDGSPPNDNPFYNAADGISARDHVYAYGLRNPFGGAWRAANNRHYNVENGPSVDRLTAILPGVSYGWTGGDASMFINAIYNWSPATAPVNIAFIQPQTFNASGFPPDKHDHAFVTESGPTYAGGPQARGKRITEIVLDPSDNLISGPTTLVEYVGTGRATAVGLAAGPDGLYFTDLYKDMNAAGPTDPGASVLRVRFVGAAAFDIDSPAGPAPHTTAFTNTSTLQGTVSSHWTLGDGTTSDLDNPSHTYTDPGLYTVRLTSSSEQGVYLASKTRAVSVGDTRSVAFIAPLPLNASDQGAVDHMRSWGLGVAVYSENPAQRPAPATTAAQHDLVVISSTVLSSNLADQFDQQPVPVLFWEQALGTPDRMALATSGATLVTQGDFLNLDDTHPISDELQPGINTLFTTDATTSLLSAPFAPGATALLQSAADPNQAGLVAVEAGATLTDGQTAPARRVFFFLEDSSFQSLNADGLRTFSRALAWALGIDRPAITLQPLDEQAGAGQNASFTTAHSSPIPAELTWTRDGADLPNTGAPTLSLSAVSTADAGTYRARIENLAGIATSNPATLAVETCPPDMNNDGVLDNGDIGAFVAAFLASDLAADFNNDGILDNGDISAFVAAFLAGC